MCEGKFFIIENEYLARLSVLALLECLRYDGVKVVNQKVADGWLFKASNSVRGKKWESYDCYISANSNTPKKTIAQYEALLERRNR